MGISHPCPAQVSGDPLGLYGTETKWAAYVFPALNAKELYFRERDYIVDKGELKIVDEFTGRVMEGRRWNGGLHQAVEAKEKVEVKPEQITVASITYQSLFLLYPTLGGMTGTAKSEAKELQDTYGLDVIKVPTCVDSNRWFGGSQPNFRTLYLGHIEVDSADFWTNRLLSSSSRAKPKSLVETVQLRAH